MSKEPCNIASIHTQKFLDEEGNLNIKCGGWKTFKKYKTQYDKESINIIKGIVKDEINNNIDKKDKLVAKYQKLYTNLISTSLSKGTYDKKLVPTDDMKDIMYKIQDISDMIKLLEENYDQFGITPPKKIRYTNRRVVY